MLGFLTTCMVTIALSIGATPYAYGDSVQTPITLIPSLSVGWRVGESVGSNVCAVVHESSCAVGLPSSGAGGFKYPSSVAVAPDSGRVYVADTGNDRVEEFTGDGVFLSTFGWGVNGAHDARSGAARAVRNLCGAASVNGCTAGVPGSGAWHLNNPSSIAVAPVTGDVYVLEIGPEDYRIDEYTAEGRFVWMVGRGVNASTGANACSEAELSGGDIRCRGGSVGSAADLQPGAFKFAQFAGNLLAVGGPKRLLYVGDEHRVQEFATDGKWQGEISLVSLSAAPQSAVAALAVDGRGYVYVVYRVAPTASDTGENTGTVHVFSPDGEQVRELAVLPLRPEATIGIVGMAVDRFGHLAVVGGESGPERNSRFYSPHFGAVYELGSGRELSRFHVPNDYDGIAFNSSGDLYVAATDDQEIVGYVPAPAQELLTNPVACGIGRSAFPPFNCMLNGDL